MNKEKDRKFGPPNNVSKLNAVLRVISRWFFYYFLEIAIKMEIFSQTSSKATLSLSFIFKDPIKMILNYCNFHFFEIPPLNQMK
jgi:hypothetical protein